MADHAGFQPNKPVTKYTVVTQHRFNYYCNKDEGQLSCLRKALVEAGKLGVPDDAEFGYDTQNGMIVMVWQTDDHEP
jgi:hypothetical protein